MDAIELLIRQKRLMDNMTNDVIISVLKAEFGGRMILSEDNWYNCLKYDNDRWRSVRVTSVWVDDDDILRMETIEHDDIMVYGSRLYDALHMIQSERNIRELKEIDNGEEN